MTKKKEIVETFKKMSNAKVIKYWNEYVGENCIDEEDYAHNMIHTNNSAVFNSFFTPYDAVMSVIYGHYNEDDDYVIIDENENVQSFTNWDDAKSPVDMNILIDWLIEKYALTED